ncbi:thiosulfate dehydrogenase [quinone] large subunit [Wenyingzhuangia heitensis]|uniref:Thiosulfate dehydrogenase [quinone] large subunit n=1 Tax=Wenyingzhuangia heitensis TaxID=1487859 RepID=A0ABX0UFD7_9FLAO|nr:DoxX family protein [Wenyingzhuangia heitensis]NIJ45722.1 thiosulfate dehydrogenase [quinone] large subunit [Wenyingzhuangia heitensis]
MKTSTPKQTAYALLRITMGVNFFAHGLVRIPKLNGFRNWMVNTFENSLLPNWSVYAWGSILPFVELAIGILLIVGYKTYQTTIAGALVIITLILGSCLIENWDWAATQMLYSIFFYFLISNIEQNYFALDHIKIRV